MKRYLISGLTIVAATLMIAPMAMAGGPLPRTGQVTLHDSEADMTGNGRVSIGELVRYNRDQRGS
ncbi:MAG: hypothetical protein EA342_16940 [Leptolyngbya sp. LCM1.Bin17]|jgi:hypothetical protein|nr:MAG: hypothetical protein EA342_16940 [Leptolyngbya sp. LCM1.Bin17]